MVASLAFSGRGPYGLVDFEPLRQFWEFATNVRKTKSMASDASLLVRGRWFTRLYVVQRVHGWGQRSVRLLCVGPLESEERRKKMETFFAQEMKLVHNFLSNAHDPLDDEPERVLIKIPYNCSLQAAVDREISVLQALQGLPGVPVLLAPVICEDVEVRALVCRFSNAPSLQESLENRQLTPVEGIYRVLAFMLKTLEPAHHRGWMHLSFQPRDVLLPPCNAESSEEREDMDGRILTPLICGWGRATRNDGDRRFTAADLLDIIRQLPGSEVPKPPGNGDEGCGAETAPAADVGYESGSITTCAAPEQLIGAYSGIQCAAQSTDIWHCAAVTLQSLSGSAAWADSGLHSRLAVARRMCRGAISRRAENVEQAARRFSADEVDVFLEEMTEIMQATVQTDCVQGEWAIFFQSCLSCKPENRPQTIAESLTMLDSAQSALETRMLVERKRRARSSTISGDEVDQAEKGLEGDVNPWSWRRRGPVFVEKPPELQDMHVL